MTDLVVNEGRLVEWASEAIDRPSFTGSEQAMGELMAETFAGMGLQVQWQQVEDGRPNVLGTWVGTGGGKSLMFNGHMDTSYSGREPWLAGVAGFQPKAFVKDGRLFGLGISNMKGALACYVEAVRALQDAGVRLKGDVMIAAVSGEIEKAQWGDAQGAEYRGYAAGSRYLVTHGGVADMCLLGEPTEGKLVLGHFGSLWVRISTREKSRGPTACSMRASDLGRWMNPGRSRRGARILRTSTITPWHSTRRSNTTRLLLISALRGPLGSRRG